MLRIPTLFPLVAAATIGLAGAAALAHAGHPELLRMMDQYEAVRAALAADDFPAALRAGRSLTTAAHAAHGKVAARMKPYVSKIAEAAQDFVKTEADPQKLRLAFGELSRRVITYLDQDGGVAQGRFAFECPMASGYGKWVQTDEKVSNPYMGKSMPTCGGASKMKP